MKGQNAAEKLGAVAYVECSALENIGVMGVFETAARAALGYAPPRPPKAQPWFRRFPIITAGRRLLPAAASSATSQSPPGASGKPTDSKNPNYLVANMPDPSMWSFEIESAVYAAMTNNLPNDSGKTCD